ncbi:MAG: 2,3-bisphosphoglycerate-independent phosphoglycerate mutase [Patescibacteria group bacterium]|jgi:2,3-bisphosphoglycerate-independent phosphoglycerate mutase
MDKKKTNPFVLVILDGWGITKETRGNAVALGNTPVIDTLMDNYPHSLLGASGKDVGLPPGQDGNSEAGHLNIGAGRIVEQESVIISRSINEGTFFRNPAFLAAIHHVKKNNSTLHLMGLITDQQSAHADPDHLLALLTFARLKNVHKVCLHLFTDGRDSYQFLAIKLLNKLKKILVNSEKIGTIIGRYYAMDRIKEWARTKMAYEALVMGKGHQARDAQEAVLQAYNRHENDEYIMPTVINSDGQANGRICDNDTVIFFNLRSDRVRELTKALVQPDFIGFKRDKVLKNLLMVTLTDFGPDLPGVLPAYPARVLHDTLPAALQGLRQLYISETEKFAHVTYFINGGHDHTIAGESRIMVKSPTIPSYKDKPEMSADQLTDIIVKSIEQDKYDFILVNYPNPDMIGHTGDLAAGIKAVQKVDYCVGRLQNIIGKKDGTMIVIADHGNIEEMIDLETGQVDTSHSANPVPFIIFNKHISRDEAVKKGVLSDIAPTIIHMMGRKKPREMGNKILCRFQINQQS